MILIVKLVITLSKTLLAPCRAYCRETKIYERNAVSEVSSENRDQVAHCRDRIKQLLKLARLKRTPTHFVSIPIRSDQLCERFAAFKSEVLQTCGKVECLLRGIGIKKSYSACTKYNKSLFLSIN